MPKNWLNDENGVSDLDGRISFDEPTHKYTLDGKQLDISVSSLWAREFPSFDPDKTVRMCYKSWRDKENDRYATLLDYLDLVKHVRTEEGRVEALVSLFRAQGCVEDEPKMQKRALKAVHSAAKETQKGYFQLIQYVTRVEGERWGGDAILNTWNANGRRAADVGTHWHAQFEFYALQEPTVTFKDYPEGRQFMRFREKYSFLEPFLVEYVVFDEEGRVAGMVDSIWKDTRSGDLWMIGRGPAPITPVGAPPL